LGTEPQLVGARYYRYIEEGLELLVHIENKGDKMARDVEYEETMEVKGQPEDNTVTFKGDVPGGSSQTVEQLLTTLDPTEVRFSKSTEITYKDSQGQAKTLALQPDWKRIEYDFPLTPRDIITIGRDSEIQVISTLVDQVWQLTHGQYRPGLKRLLLMRGVEGAGKTKLVYELLERAQQRGFQCFVEDAKDRSPVKRMLRRLLGLRPDIDNEKLIWKQLDEQLPDEEHNLQRQTIFRFISTMPVQFSEEEMDLLKANALALVNRLCRHVPTLLVFENTHWTPEGAEEQLLSALLHNVLLSKDVPVLLCATYRPGEGGALPVIGKLEMSRDYYEVLELGAMDEEGVEAIVDRIVDFPRFSETLHRFVYDRSHGNPLYLIEILRLLTNPTAKYLTRVGCEWYPAYAVDLNKALPETIEEVILERVDLELPHEADFVKTLSALGFELPLNLIEALVTREFPKYSAHDLDRHLTALEEAGFLVVPDKVGRLSKVEGYEFEHQIKREVLYDSLSESRRLQLRKHVAEILLADRIFADPDEQLRQLARHLAKSPRDFRAAHVEEIKKAATLERGLRNFSRSLEFYDAALDLVSENSFEAAHLMVERSRLQQMRGNLVPAEQDLQQAYRLVAPESSLAKQDDNRAKDLRTLIEKEQGRLLLKQPQASLDRANDLLYRARIGLEGNLRLRRFFPPKSTEFHRDLVEIYLALAEVWLRKRRFKVCERACKRAERLARKARTKLQDESLLPRVYKALGDLHLERGIEGEDYEEALTWYQLALKSVEKDRYEQERLWVALAETYRVLGNSAKARQHYEKAIEIQKQLGDIYGLALSYGGIGDLFVEQEAFEKGRYYCEQAHQHQQSVGDLNRFWRTCVSLTKIYQNDGNFEAAGKYWFQARDILFEQHRFYELRIKKQQEIYSLVCRLAEYYREDEQWSRLRTCLQDRDYILPTISWEREELASVQIQLGEAYFRTRQWQEAIAAFTEALEVADKLSTRAKIHEWLGDVYANFESPTRTLAPTKVEAEKVLDQTERHYEEAVKQLVCLGNVQPAVAVYEKLLDRIVTDEASLVQLPFTYLRILHKIQPQQLQQRIHDQLVDKTEEVLLRNELPAEAGDILVYTAREVSRLDDSVIPFDEKLTYLRRAEALYREGGLEDLIWGLNMLIPSYYRFGLWEEVVHCFEELFELNIQVRDADEFIESCRTIPILSDRIDRKKLEHFIDIAVTGPQRIQFSQQQQVRLYLYVAKFHSHIADKMDEAKDLQRYHGLALEYYEKVQEMARQDTAMTATALHDSALIYQHREEYDEALQRLSEAIRIAERVGDYKSSGESRSMRAQIYAKLEQFDEAYSDYERSLEFLQRAGRPWTERLQLQDQQPLSPAEVVSMRYSIDWLATTCMSFAEFLIFRDELSRARDLAEQATYLYKTIGKPEAAKAAQKLLIFSNLMSDAGSLPPIVSVKRGWSCPSCGTLLIEGLAECPECGEWLCPQCGASIKKETTQCPECRAKLAITCPGNGSLDGEDEENDKKG
jgi:tetratricopeptide (TPR) repeat protein